MIDQKRTFADRSKGGRMVEAYEMERLTILARRAVADGTWMRQFVPTWMQDQDEQP